MNYLTTDDLQDVLKIGPKQARALMLTEGFPTIKIGRQYRVEEEAMRKWLSEKKEIRLDYSKC